MTTNTLRACARKITEFYERFASAFGRKEARRHALVYLKGLLLAHGRKNVERIALRFATASDGSPDGRRRRGGTHHRQPSDLTRLLPKWPGIVWYGSRWLVLP